MTIHPDAELRSAILDELAWDPRVDPSRIDVSVADGVVTMVGTVASYAEKLLIQEAASLVEGVHDLIDDVDVKPATESQPADEDLLRMAEQVLAWDALVPEQNLTISASDGWIILAGEVDVDSQRQEAARAIARLSGIRGVTNGITVRAPELAPSDVRREITDALRRRAAHRANQIDVVVDERSVTLRGPTQTRLEKVAILGAVSHAPGIELVRDELYIDPES